MGNPAAQHIMLDTETLSLKRNAAVIEIGACLVFNPEISFQDYIRPDEYTLVPAVAAKFHIDPQTVKWHKNGNSPSYGVAETRGASPYSVAKSFWDWLRARQEIGPLYLWANGGDFDFPVLVNLLESAGLSVPWSYRCVRDLRTLVNMMKTDKPAGANHSALQDALTQAQWLRDCCEKYSLELA